MRPEGLAIERALDHSLHGGCPAAEHVKQAQSCPTDLAGRLKRQKVQTEKREAWF